MNFLFFIILFHNTQCWYIPKFLSMFDPIPANRDVKELKSTFRNAISSTYLGEAYLELRYLLNLYHIYFLSNSSGYEFWYDSILVEMNDSIRSTILRELHGNINTISDIEEFWRKTEGKLLKDRLASLDRKMEKISDNLSKQAIITDNEQSVLVKWNMSYEKRAKFLIDEYLLISAHLLKGLSVYENNSYADVFKHFLMATAEKKKLDQLFKGKEEDI